MSKPKILIQLDPDGHASVFDAVVAVDSGVDHLFQYHQVSPTNVRELVHGAIFTRGGTDLKRTAIFVGGSNVGAAEELLVQVQESFFGPMRVSVLFDANGANTTAAAAVLVAARHLELSGATAAVLGATGPVGQRAVQLLAHAGTRVRVASRKLARAESVCHQVAALVPDARLVPYAASDADDTVAALKDVQVLIAVGAAGVEMVSPESWAKLHGLEVAIDLNAVPPTGVAQIQPQDAGEIRRGITCYGAIGVGGLKMKIHKAAISQLFEAHDQVLDAQQVYQIGKTIEHRTS